MAQMTEKVFYTFSKNFSSDNVTVDTIRKKWLSRFESEVQPWTKKAYFSGIKTWVSFLYGRGVLGSARKDVIIEAVGRWTKWIAKKEEERVRTTSKSGTESNPKTVSAAQNSSQDQPVECPTGFSPPEGFPDVDDSFTVWEHFEAVDVIAYTPTEEYDCPCKECLREDCPGLCFGNEIHSCARPVDRCCIHKDDFIPNNYDRFCEHCLSEDCNRVCITQSDFHGA